MAFFAIVEILSKAILVFFCPLISLIWLNFGQFLKQFITLGMILVTIMV